MDEEKDFPDIEEIEDPEGLFNLLRNKPWDWGLHLSLRSAMRAFPQLLYDNDSESVDGPVAAKIHLIWILRSIFLLSVILKTGPRQQISTSKYEHLYRSSVINSENLSNLVDSKKI